MQKQDELAIVVRVRDFATAALEKVKAVVGGIGGHIAGLPGTGWPTAWPRRRAIMVAAKACERRRDGREIRAAEALPQRLAAAYGTTADSWSKTSSACPEEARSTRRPPWK
jgi:hypothetical protein